MPQVTVYVREEDLDAWKGIIKKSEFIHNALQHLSTYDGSPIVLRETLPEQEVPEENTSVSQAKEEGFVEVRPFLSGEQSGEFPCCDKQKPCQHWSFDGELWVNSLSGRKKEVA